MSVLKCFLCKTRDDGWGGINESMPCFLMPCGPVLLIFSIFSASLIFSIQMQIVYLFPFLPWQKLYKTSRAMQERIMELLATVENEDVITELIQMNENLNNVLLGHERYYYLLLLMLYMQSMLTNRCAFLHEQISYLLLLPNKG